MISLQQLHALPELGRALRSQWWPAQRLRDLQHRRLRAMLHHAVSAVPHYRRMHIGGLDRPPDQTLLDFPYLDKQQIQLAGRDLLADGFDAARLPQSRTSGSTGEPTTTWFDDAAWRYTRHVLKWRRVLAHVRPWGLRLLLVTESASRNAARHRPRLPGLPEITNVPIGMAHADALSLVLRMQPHVIYAFPSWLRELIETAAERGVELPRAECIMTSSEVLTDNDRDTISSAFGARVSDVYGTTELKDIAWQCRAGSYHVNAESVWVEIDAPPGQSGEIVVTGLVNRAMPLIRFRTGDLARWQSGPCSCGRSSPALSDIQGRVMEMMDLPGGRRLSPYLLTTSIESDPGIRNYRIEQHAKDYVLVRYRARPGQRVHEASIIQRVRDVLGDDVTVECRADPDLQPPATGKRSIYQRLCSAA